MVNAEKFLEAFGNIDDEFIEEAMNYTMKKKFNFKPIIAAAACLVLAVTAYPMAKYVGGLTTQQTHVEKIGVNGNYTAYESGLHAGDIELNANHNVELVINTGGEFVTDEAKKGTTKTIEFNGKTWTGTYKDTKISSYYADDEDNYIGKKDGKQFSFSINKTTGVCTSFYASDSGNAETTEILTQDECYAVAIEYLKKYVDDVENYELKHVYERDWENGYYFMIYRTTNGIATSDRVSIGVRKTGEVYTHIFHSLGAMKNVDASAISMGVIDKVIGTKVRSIYANNYELTYSAEDVVLTKLADGSYIFDCVIKVEGRPDAESALISDTCLLAITID